MPENNENLVDQVEDVVDDVVDNPTPPSSNDCCKYVIGNHSDFDVKDDDCEVNVEKIKVKSIEDKVRIRGEVVNCSGEGIANILVNLLIEKKDKDKTHFEGVAHTVTDCKGNYLFEVERPDKKDSPQKYKVIVGKAAKGKERTTGVEGGDCHNTVCSNSCLD